LIAFGPKEFFKNGWSCLDFLIVLVSIFILLSYEIQNSKLYFIFKLSSMRIIAQLAGLADLSGMKAMRTLRALRPLRTISKFEGLRVVVNSLIRSIPSVINVVLICIVFWLVFSILGVQFFAGKFYKCVYANETRVSYDIVANKTECLAKNLTWMNSRINFDNVANSYLALLQVATFKGWTEIMADASDIGSEVDF
jgi:voltage-gated sodium channel type II alpha